MESWNNKTLRFLEKHLDNDKINKFNELKLAQWQRKSGDKILYSVSLELFKEFGLKFPQCGEHNMMVGTEKLKL